MGGDDFSWPPAVVAVDYDGTYSRIPELLDPFIAALRQYGHKVICVTARGPDDPVKFPGEVFYTNGEPKAKFMFDLGHSVDIWIDDAPYFIGRPTDD